MNETQINAEIAADLVLMSILQPKNYDLISQAMLPNYSLNMFDK